MVCTSWESNPPRPLGVVVVVVGLGVGVGLGDEEPVGQPRMVPNTPHDGAIVVVVEVEDGDDDDGVPVREVPLPEVLLPDVPPPLPEAPFWGASVDEPGLALEDAPMLPI